MEDISALSGGGGAQGLGVSIGSSSELKDQFLNLLVTQLQNQDPLNPMDNGAMVEQLATFSNLEQLEGINSKLETNMGYTQSLNNTMMMNLVGKRVTVLGDGVSIENGSPSRSLARTTAPGKGQILVRDAAGTVVREINDYPIQAGFTEIQWDGKDKDGRTLPDGEYQLEISVSNGETWIPAALFESGIVDTIQFDNNAQKLLVNGRLFTPADVVEVGVGQPYSSGTYPPPLPPDIGQDPLPDAPAPTRPGDWYTPNLF